MKTVAQAYQQIKAKQPHLLQKPQLYSTINSILSFPIDPILFRQAFLSFSKSTPNPYSLPTITSFFSSTTANLFSIEAAYLPPFTADEFTFNKDNISKFLKDEPQHYQQTFHKNAIKTAVAVENMPHFLRDLFHTSYTKVVYGNVDYFQTQYLAHIRGKLTAYTADTAIEEDDLLDFMTYWLKEEKQMWVFYRRIEERLKEQVQDIVRNNIKNTFLGLQQTPQHIPTRQEDLDRQFIAAKQVKQQQVRNQDTTNEQKPQNTLQQSIIQYSSQTNQRLKPRIQKMISVQCQVVAKSKQQLLQQCIPQLFEFGCKNRYAVHRNLTFDSILDQTKNLTLQKFINLCNYLQIPQYIARDKLSGVFKSQAMNRRAADLPRFRVMVQQMVQMNERVVDNLLKKRFFDVKRKREQVYTDRRNLQHGSREQVYTDRRNPQHGSQPGISPYKFILRPINGKDIQTMQEELISKKNRRNRRGERVVTVEKTVVRESKEEERITPSQLQVIRDRNFDLKQYIVQEDNDALWNMYQAKIVGREGKGRKGLVQSFLPKII